MRNQAKTPTNQYTKTKNDCPMACPYCGIVSIRMGSSRMGSLITSTEDSASVFPGVSKKSQSIAARQEASARQDEICVELSQLTNSKEKFSSLLYSWSSNLDMKVFCRSNLFCGRQAIFAVSAPTYIIVINCNTSNLALCCYICKFSLLIIIFIINKNLNF